jgi:hypothetical protein
MSRTPTYRDVQPITDLVTDEEAYEAMLYLDSVAHDFAIAQANADYAEYSVQIAEATGAVMSDETSADKRKYEARTSPLYKKKLDTWRRSKITYLEIKAKREAAQTKIDVWRTIHADKRLRDVTEPGRR